MTDFSPLTQLAILTTARWAAMGVKPLTNGEFLELRRWLGSTDDAVESLLTGTRDLDGCPVDHERLLSLLQRGLGVFSLVDKWLQSGLWIRSWSDKEYPSRFKQLRVRAPSLLFGYGNPEAFSARALAIVGSRSASEERLAKAAEIGRACARASITIVSGGARGVDTTAMKSGIAGGGTVVGVLADSLLKTSGSRDYRGAIQDGRLCLMSEVHPEAKFDVGSAMARNRLAYACADATLVVECDPGSGGTWQGASEARREGKTVYVLEGAKAEHELVALGAVAIGMDFALSPERLINGERPQTPGVDALLNWLRALASEVGPDIAAMTAKLENEASGIAQQIVELIRVTGIDALPISVRPTYPTEEALVGCVPVVREVHEPVPTAEKVQKDRSNSKYRRRSQRGAATATLFESAAPAA